LRSPSLTDACAVDEMFATAPALCTSGIQNAKIL